MWILLRFYASYLVHKSMEESNSYMFMVWAHEYLHSFGIVDTPLLRKEYRFNRDILDLINHYYDNQLVADYSVQTKDL
jgi:hypothetical protein